MYWFLLVVVLLFIGFIYNVLEYVKEMIEELNDPVPPWPEFVPFTSQ